MIYAYIIVSINHNQLCALYRPTLAVFSNVYEAKWKVHELESADSYDPMKEYYEIYRVRVDSFDGQVLMYSGSPDE